MVSVILEIMNSYCMVILIQIGMEVLLIERKKQSNISLSTTKQEYIAAYSASCEAIWLWTLLTGLFELDMEATMILCDNHSCIKMTEEPNVP
jgi:hypothetical protein